MQGQVGLHPQSGVCVTTKTCTKCGVEKPLEGFYKHKKGRLGRVSQCKECMRQHKREKRLKDPEGEREKARKYRVENVEIYRRSHAKWRLKNIEQERQRARIYRAENLADLREKDRLSRRDNANYYNSLYAKTKAEKQEVTISMATKVGVPWEPDEDSFITSNFCRMDTYQMAIYLGRTWEATRSRYTKLKKELNNVSS